jgi:LysM repeat protein
VTETKGNVYYTLDVGYIAGRPASNNGTPFPTALPGTAVTSTSEAAGGDTATPSRVEPVQTASPQADGKVVHVVQQGQALWSIAIAYGVKIVDLAALNGLSATQPVVYVGQKLVIHPAFTPTTSPTVTDTPAPPTRTLAPSSTQSPPTMTFTPGSTRTQTPLPLLPKLPSLGSNQRQSIGIILVVVCGLGLAGVLASRFLKKKP